MSEYKIIESKEIVWCQYDDRYVYIEREDNEVTGINFMQGDELDYFKDHYLEPYKELTKFYHATRMYLIGPNELDRINQAIWAYVSYRND